jgi:alpha-L-rhamnosidase
MRLSHPSVVPAIFLCGTLCILWASMLWAREEPPANGAGLTPTYLRCEYLVDPLGIDVRAPQLSWIVESSARGQKQTAYQVLVADYQGTLARDEGNLWDSGRVASDETSTIVYAGRPLRSHQACYWKVRVWDKDGKPSGWTRPALWTMGPLEPSDWQEAEWIGSDNSRKVDLPEAPFGGAKWIWHAGDKGPNKPQTHRLFVTSMRLPAGEVEKAELIATADDFFYFTINGQLVINREPGTAGWERPHAADVTADLKPGADNTIRVEVNNGSPGPAGLLARLTVTMAHGRTTTLVTDGSWKTLEDPGANWHNRALDTRDWPVAEVLGDYGIAPWGKLKFPNLVLPPPAYLRTSFHVDRPVYRATLYATGLGIFDVHCNGRRVSEDRFNPGWTDYSKRVYYRAYDVTREMRRGENALGAILADGWYSGYVGFGQRRDHYGRKPRFRAILHLEMVGGRTEDIVTDSKWRASTGPIREADFLMGETYDAGKAMPGWDEPGFDDGGWHRVDRGAELHPVVQWHPGPPVRAFAELKPKSIAEPKPGTYVFDLGQNFAGVVRLRVSGGPTRKITLRFAERLNPDGTIYTKNLREARVTDTYLSDRSDAIDWEPRFTFHGFQYVEVTGLSSRPTEDTITGIAVSSDTPVVGSFACSDPMLNRLFSNIYWTQRANFIDIPTDCPQRDERLGWTGDAQVYIETASLICDVQAFFNKWLVDLADGQRADGQFPRVAPVKVAGDDGGPAWADAGVICPSTIYQVYGDRRLLERQYPSMVKFVEFCRKRSTPDLLPPAQFHCFGDWLSINADTPKDVIYTAYFAHSARLTADAAEALGRKDDAAKYHQLFERIRDAFKRAYVGPDGRIKGNTQAVYVLAIDFGLVEPKSVNPSPGSRVSDGKDFDRAARYLVEDIEKRGNHLSTGFIGTKSLMQALSRTGRNDVAFRLLHNDTFPSWGFSIKHGATSIWERWDGWTPEKGFQDPGMNSFAHYSFGAVYGWMVQTIGGLAVASKEVEVIVPRFDPNLTWAKTSYKSRFGTVATEWKRDGDYIEFQVTIPANSTGLVWLPTTDVSQVTEGGRPAAQAEHVNPMGPAPGGDGQDFYILSGTYRFRVKIR